MNKVYDFSIIRKEYMSNTGKRCQPHRNTYIHTHTRAHIHNYILSLLLSCLMSSAQKENLIFIPSYLESKADFPCNQLLPGIEDDRIPDFLPFTVSFHLAIEGWRFSSFGMSIVWTHSINLPENLNIHSIYCWLNMLTGK